MARGLDGKVVFVNVAVWFKFKMDTSHSSSSFDAILSSSSKPSPWLSALSISSSFNSGRGLNTQALGQMTFNFPRRLP